MADIDYFFATISPYTYLAGTRLEQIAARHGATIEYKPVDLLALFPRTGGLPPKDRHPARQEYRAQELRRQSRKLGVPFNLQPAFFPTNPAPSAYAIIAAQAAGGSAAPAMTTGPPAAAIWANWCWPSPAPAGPRRRMSRMMR